MFKSFLVMWTKGFMSSAVLYLHLWCVFFLTSLITLSIMASPQPSWQDRLCATLAKMWTPTSLLEQKYWSWTVWNTLSCSGNCVFSVLLLCTKGVNNSNLPRQMQWCADAGLIKAPIGKLHSSAKIASNGKKGQARGGADTSAPAIIRQSFMHQPKPQHFLFVLKFQIKAATRCGHRLPEINKTPQSCYIPILVNLVNPWKKQLCHLGPSRVTLILLRTWMTMILTST